MVMIKESPKHIGGSTTNGVLYVVRENVRLMTDRLNKLIVLLEIIDSPKNEYKSY